MLTCVRKKRLQEEEEEKEDTKNENLIKIVFLCL